MFDQIRMSKRFFPKSGKIAALHPTWIASVPQNNCGENATDLTKFRHEPGARHRLPQREPRYRTHRRIPTIIPFIAHS
ncbi:MAG: hypothetical protein WD065_18180 [Planctomycetaceae bacterium]